MGELSFSENKLKEIFGSSQILCIAEATPSKWYQNAWQVFLCQLSGLLGLALFIFVLMRWFLLPPFSPFMGDAVPAVTV